MPDITEQLQAWSRSLADATEPVGIERVTSGNGHARMVASRRLMAVAASVVLLIGGIVATELMRKLALEREKVERLRRMNSRNYHHRVTMQRAIETYCNGHEYDVHLTERAFNAMLQACKSSKSE